MPEAAAAMAAAAAEKPGGIKVVVDKWRCRPRDKDNKEGGRGGGGTKGHPDGIVTDASGAAAEFRVTDIKLLLSVDDDSITTSSSIVVVASGVRLAPACKTEQRRKRRRRRNKRPPHKKIKRNHINFLFKIYLFYCIFNFNFTK